MKKILIVILFILLIPIRIFSYEEIETLNNLSFQDNPKLKLIRDDIKQTMSTVMSGRPEKNLPDLKFYTYKVKEKENFWVVLSKCSLDMDTLMSVNGLTSPYQVVPGTVLYIPNMRGIVVSGDNLNDVYTVTTTEKINIKYVKTVNKSESLQKKFIFIPCGKISSLERSLFLGTAFLSPIQYGKTTSGFGSRKDPFNSQRTEFHKGIDLGCRIGTNVLSARSGEVVFSGYDDGYGYLVIIEHEFGYKSYYGHLSKISVKKGDFVKTGSLIALSGNTGRSTGPHLHFEIRKNDKALNPMSFLSRGKR